MIENGIKILCDSEMAPIAELTAYANNSKQHPPEQIEQLAQMIKKVGWTAPMLVTGEGRIVAGHGRLDAAIVLKMKNVPVVRLGDITEAEYKALVIADNKIAENAGWHFDILAEEIKELELLDFDLDLLGFEETDMTALLKELDAETESHYVENAKVNEARQKTFSPTKPVAGEEDLSENVSDGDFGDAFTLPDGDKSDLEQITFTVSSLQMEVIKEALAAQRSSTEIMESHAESFGNDNSNGNAIYQICVTWKEGLK